MSKGVHDPQLGQSPAVQPVDTIKLGTNPYDPYTEDGLLWIGKRLNQIVRRDNRSAIDEECDRILAGQGSRTDLLQAAHDTTVAGKDRAESLIVLLWNALVECKALHEERAEAIVTKLQRQGWTKTTDTKVLKALAIKDFADEAVGIANAIRDGSMEPQSGKVALYALQVALSAARTIDQATANKKKEARLRRTTNSPREKSRRHASPKPEARGKGHHTKKKPIAKS